MNDATHCFEKAGLGLAPFTYAGMEAQEISYGQRVIGHVGGCEVTTKPGGTCAYCGTYIVNMFNVTSADGNKFHVGCECIKKTGDAGLIRKVEDATRKMNKARRDAREKAKIADAKTFVEESLRALAGTFSNLPHPNSYMAQDGKTMFDYLRFLADIKAYCKAATVIKTIS